MDRGGQFESSVAIIRKAVYVILTHKRVQFFYLIYKPYETTNIVKEFLRCNPLKHIS